jgi:hypothetical protein
MAATASVYLDTAPGQVDEMNCVAPPSFRALLSNCARFKKGSRLLGFPRQMCENVLGGAESAPRFVTNGLNKEDWLQQRAKAIRALPGSHSIQFIFCHIGDDETQRGPRKSDKY